MKTAIIVLCQVDNKDRCKTDMRCKNWSNHPEAHCNRMGSPFLFSIFTVSNKRMVGACRRQGNFTFNCITFSIVAGSSAAQTRQKRNQSAARLAAPSLFPYQPFLLPLRESHSFPQTQAWQTYLAASSLP